MLKRSLFIAAVISVAGSASAFAQASRTDQSASSWLGAYAGGALAYSSVSKTAADNKPKGFSGVGIIGANVYSFSSVIVGVEGSASLFGSVKDGDSSAGAAWSVSSRAGYVMGDFMPFVSLGVGRGEGKYQAEKAYFTSMIYGVGLEHRLTSSLNWRAEAMVAPSMTSKTLGGTSVQPNALIVRTGLTFKFF